MSSRLDALTARGRAGRAFVAACLFVSGAPGCAFWDVSDSWSKANGATAGDDGGAPDATPGAGRYADVVLGDRPLGYWKLDETGGTVAHDSSGHGHDGVLAGEVRFGARGATAGGTGASFGGGRISVGDGGEPFAFVGRRPFTIEAWVDASTLDGEFRRIVSKERSGEPRDGFTVFLHEDPKFAVGFEFLVADVQSSIAAPFRTGVYTHVVAVYDGARASLYVDGARAATAPSERSLTAHPGLLVWGATSATNGGTFLGLLDELAIYDRALSAEAVAAHMAARSR